MVVTIAWCSEVLYYSIHTYANVLMMCLLTGAVVSCTLMLTC
jgi:hypothetical protein